MPKANNQNKRDIPVFARFRTQLFVLIFLVFVPAFILTIRTNFRERRLNIQNARERTIATAKLVAAKQESYVKNAEQLLTTLSQTPFLTEAKDCSFFHIHFINLVKLYPDYLDVGLIEADGTFFCGASTNHSRDLSKWPLFQRVSEAKRFVIGDFDTNETTGPTLDFGYPVFNEKKQLKRVFFARLDLKQVQKSIAEIEPSAGETVVTLFDGKGNVLAQHPDPHQLTGSSLAQNPFVERLLQDKEDIFEMRGIDGVEELFGIATVNDGVKKRLWISVGVPSESIFASANWSLWNNIVLMIIVAVVALMIAYFYAKHFFLQPLQSLVSEADLLKNGKWFPRWESVNRKGELGELSRTFNEMALAIEDQRKDIEKINAGLEQRVRDRTRQLEEANREIESFSYSVSHDLRAPLRHIAGFVNMLGDELGATAGPKSQRFMKVIADSTKQMGELVDELLAFSKMGRVEMQKTIVDTNKLVEEVIENLPDEPKERNIVWNKGNLPQLQADPAMLRQVFVNLISNAIKYSQPRDPSKIDIGHQDEEDENIIFVRDNGVGFDMQFADKLFGVFQRLHQAEEFEGTGIGLANVRRIVQRHGGRTWAEGVVNGGATFYFSLPKAVRK